MSQIPWLKYLEITLACLIFINIKQLKNIYAISLVEAKTNEQPEVSSSYYIFRNLKCRQFCDNNLLISVYKRLLKYR